MNNTKESIWTKSFIATFLLNFFVFLVFYGLLTTLPVYVVSELHRSKTAAGLVITTFLITAIIIRPFSAKFLEAYGKKKILIVSITMYLISTFLYIVIHQFVLLLILRAFQGIWFSLVTTSTNSIAIDVIPEKRRGEGMGYFVMSMNIAVVVGPFLALSLLQIVSFNLLFLILSLIMLVGMGGLIMLNIPASEAPISSRTLSIDDLFERRAIPIAFIGSLVALAYSSILSFLSVYARELNLIEAASFFFVFFAVAMLATRPFVGRLFDTKGPSVIIYPAFVLFALGLFLLSITHSAWLLLLSGAIVGLGYGSIVPAFQTLAVQSADRSRGGHAISTFFTFFDTGIAAGSYILGVIATLFGYSDLYLFSAFFLLVTMALCRWVQKKRAAVRALKNA